MRLLFTSLFIFVACNLAVAQRVDPCKIFGSFYKVDNPGRADVIVFEEESEYFAQLRIFEEENSLYADEPGVWFFSENIGLARYRVFFTKRRSQADFTVHFVDRLAKAGCD